MNREFERDNETDRETGAVRGRSRRRQAGGVHDGYDSQQAVRRRPEAGRTLAYEGAGSAGREQAKSRRYAAAGREKDSYSYTAAASEPEKGGRGSLDGGREGSRGRSAGDGRRRKDGKREAGSDRKFYRRLAIILVIFQVVFLAADFGVRGVQQKMNLIRRDSSINMEDMTNPNLDNRQIAAMQGYWTVALFGVDSRDGELSSQTLSDVIIIANVNMDTGEIKLVSVYRDTYLSVSENGSYSKINEAYFRGGAKQAISALNRNLDLQIDDYGTFNWATVAQVVNILGGVDIDLSKEEFYYINAYITDTVKGTGIGSVQLKHAGMNHLDGIQAVAYARLRKMDTDFQRTERQREVIEQCFEKLKKADFATVNNVMETTLKGIETGVTLDDIIPLGKNIAKFFISETAGFPQDKYDAMMGSKGDCVIPDTLASNVTQLHEFLFNETDYKPSSKVNEISNRIASDVKKYKNSKPAATKAAVTEAETTAEEQETSRGEVKETETDEFGNVVETTRDPWDFENGLIDGERPGDLELETDENGVPIDPPENYGPGMDMTKPAGQGGTKPTTSGTAGYPGATSAPSPTGEEGGPGVTLAPGPGATQPSTSGALNPTAPTSGGGPASQPGQSNSATVADRPSEAADNNSGGPGSVILAP